MITKNFKQLSFAIVAATFISIGSIVAEEAKKTNNNNNTKTSAPKEKAMTPKIAFVNLQRILPTDERLFNQCSTEWQDYMTALRDTLRPLDEELQKLDEAYAKGRGEFESLQKSGMASQEAMGRKVEEMARLENQLRMKMAKREEMINAEINKAQGIIAPKLEGILNDLRTKEGWDMIIRSEALLSADNKFDRTDAVRDAINKQYTEELKAKKAAEAKK